MLVVHLPLRCVALLVGQWVVGPSATQFQLLHESTPPEVLHMRTDHISSPAQLAVSQAVFVQLVTFRDQQGKRLRKIVSKLIQVRLTNSRTQTQQPYNLSLLSACIQMC